VVNNTVVIKDFTVRQSTGPTNESGHARVSFSFVSSKSICL